MIKHKKQQMTRRAVFIVLLVLILSFFIFPIVWMTMLSFRRNADIMTMPPKLFAAFSLTNYGKVLQNSVFIRSFLNSGFIGVCTTLLTILCSSTSAYALTRFRLAGTKTLTTVLLVSRMIPAIILALPIYIIAMNMKLLDTYFIMVISITTFSLPFQIWMLLGFFSQIPTSLDESARIDGCNWYGAFFKVVLPLSKPGLAATAILTFFFSYYDLIFGITLSGRNVKPATLAVLENIGRYSFDWGAIMVSGTLLMIPTLIIGIVFQKYMIAGMTAGAVKG